MCIKCVVIFGKLPSIVSVFKIEFMAFGVTASGLKCGQSTLLR